MRVGPQTLVSRPLLETHPTFHWSRSCRPSVRLSSSTLILHSQVKWSFCLYDGRKCKSVKALFQSCSTIRSPQFRVFSQLSHSGDLINVHYSAPTRLPSGTIKSQLVSSVHAHFLSSLSADSNLPSNKARSGVSVMISL